MILETNWDITTTICQLANSGADLPSLISVMNDNYDKLDSQNLDAFITAITIQAWNQMGIYLLIDY